MRASINITGLEGLTNMYAFLGTATMAKAQRAGVAYAAKSVPPAVAKGISGAYNIRSARVKQDISRVSFVDNDQTAVIRFSRRPPTLAQFNPKPGARGHQRGLGQGLGWSTAKPKGRPLTALVVRAQGRKKFAGAFLATGANGNRLVLRRVGTGPDGRLVALYGPSIGSIFLGQSAIGTELRATVQARIEEQFRTGFERALRSAARGYGR